MNILKTGMYLGLVLGITVVSAQSTINTIFDLKYERPSITVCLLNFSEIEAYNTILPSFLEYNLDAKFNKNDIGAAGIIQSPFKRDYIYNDRYKLVQNKLNRLKIGNKVVESWFASGDTFSMDLVAKRGVYNATESELEISEKVKRGIFTLKDAGERLIDNSYILVIDFYNIQSNQSFGRNSGVIGYLYKLNWNQEKSSDFYANAWKSKDYFNKMNFEIDYITQVYLSNLGGEFASNFIDKSIELTLKEAAKSIPDLKVRTPLLSSKPLEAEVGLKEGVKIDQKFMVYERHLNRKSKMVFRLKGAIRARKPIADNRDTISGKKLTTRFYQDAGKRLNKGMLLEQRYETGLGFSLGWANRSLQGVIFRMDYNLGSLVKISQLKLYAEIQIGSGNFRFGNGTKDFQLNSTQLALGFSKEYVLHRNLHFEPSLAFVYDNTAFQFNSEEEFFITNDSLGSKTYSTNNIATGYKQFGLILGLRLPIQIFHNLQLVPGCSISTISYPKTSLFGGELPQNLATSVKRELQIDDCKSDWYKNKNPDLSADFLKWELLLRLKF